MKILIIGNPISGKGKAYKKAKKLENILSTKGYAVTSYFTRFQGDAKQYLQRNRTRFNRVIVVGGDGTLNEVINGIPDNFSTPIAQVPTGNANLLGKEIGYPNKVKEVQRTVESGAIINVDIAYADNTKFLMVAGVGFDARVTEKIKKTRLGKISNFSYLKPIYHSLNKKNIYNINVDGQEYKGSSILVCNGRNYAGIVEIAYNANLSSGLLDVIIFPSDSLISILKYFITAKFFKITALPEVTYVQGVNVKIYSNEEFPLQVDGDFIGYFRHTNIGLHPEKIPFVRGMNR